jgi:hypothetical protein
MGVDLHGGNTAAAQGYYERSWVKPDSIVGGDVRPTKPLRITQRSFFCSTTMQTVFLPFDTVAIALFPLAM